MKSIISSLVSILLSYSTFSQNKMDSLLWDRDGLKISVDKAIYKNDTMYNAVAELELIKRNERTQDCQVHYMISYNPLSLVGNYYSYEKIERGEIACGPPSSYMQAEVVDVTTNAKVKLSDLVQEKSLVHALKTNEWVREVDTIFFDFYQWHENDREVYKKYLSMLDSLNELESVLKLIQDRKTEIPKNKLLDGYAFMSYDRSKNTLEVCLAWLEYGGFDHYRYRPIFISVTPKNYFRKVLRKNEAGFFLGKFKNELIKK